MADPRVVVVGPNGMAVEAPPGRRRGGRASVTELVDQPAKVMRIGSMIKQLLEEVRALRARRGEPGPAAEIHPRSIKELEEGLAPELVDELERLSLPFTDDDGPVRGGAADRPGPAGRLARGPVPRHPDGAVRPADGGPRAVRGDARPPAAAARRRRLSPAAPGGHARRPAAPDGP